ncbi:bifunctional UDP-N-acetylglucosamine diphosphorylase/glucosamine-1-phosphate N-acetyltransferase GlmU [Henriciella mobilis]|uniref:bifunctional UDP-N-acetylglucosamine diphosphorylase/glucosamine-1-phosphate N-acetyltransferase GlmU n=1 Tax=Henriciella mobilis TaxID=2305467 RepID=UPI000E675E92|nr:bifunctional UDP-N-acetylglucosamine diphosphorylase/glucosamine-1-phosphate N-acetyltransferase GlmU [Henriciella mobilis]RIJ15513.1 bifunctional UDP-N-acetylglucosamine diphosphorylase/glucosamine-1-phosphate N-acetyltransferase GlmU [Henriciella mobilis]RIJ18977.1 bifunctional UDP-N-acetylglucosamine diphosphorylase/glucosamine-1-phosphate N-acetyltransferase GlmU [Henriciella mobilis]
MTERAAIILAAGQGTRMKSSLPKVLHRIGGRAMLDWSIDLARKVGCSRIITVISPSQPDLRAHVEAELGADAIAIQDPPLGTGHAVRSAEAALKGFVGDVIVLYGDTPLIPASAVQSLFEALEEGGAVGVLGFRAANPGAYGRLVTSAGGDLEAIVEAKDASPEQLAIDLCNSGVMAVRAERLFRLLSKVNNNNQKGEYYLTDIVALARKEGSTCKTVTCEERDVQGVNSRLELAKAEADFQDRRREELMTDGVTLVAPQTVFLSYDTIIEPDVTVEPNVVFGPGVHIRTGAMIRAFSHLEGANVEEGAEIGPYARLRPGAFIGKKAKIGNFVEVKKTRVGPGAKANHLSYLGDGDIGANANIGAGTIFCNYDGFLKYQTKIGENAFIGSNSALVAPVRIGNGAIVGSGSVIVENVSDDALALGRGRQVEKPGQAKAFREKKAAEKAARK